MSQENGSGIQHGPVGSRAIVPWTGPPGPPAGHVERESDCFSLREHEVFGSPMSPTAVPSEVSSMPEPTLQGTTPTFSAEEMKNGSDRLGLFQVECEVDGCQITFMRHPTKQLNPI